MQRGFTRRKRPLNLTIRRTPLTIVICAALLAGVVWYWASSANKASVVNAAAERPGAAAHTPAGVYHGKYVTFTYSGSYSLVLRPTPQEPNVEQALFRADTTSSKQLALIVAPIPDGGITTDPGYNYRQSHPELYSHQQVLVDGAGATEWTKNDGSERTVYITHGNYYAVVAFTIANSNDNSGLPAEVAALLQTFRWN